MRRVVLIGNDISSLLNFRIELIEDLISSGNEVYCLVYNYRSEHKKKIEEIGAKILKHGLDCKGTNPLSDIRALFFIVKQLKIIKPDIVFTYFVKPVIFGSIAARLAKTPRIIGMIEGLGNVFALSPYKLSLKKRIVKIIQIFLYKISLPLLDTLIVLNPDDKKDLVLKYKIQVNTVILGGIGVDLEKFSYRPACLLGEKSFIFVARLLREKGIFEYLQAAKRLHENYPNSQFYVLGGLEEGNTFALQKKELERYLVSGIVQYPGHVSNVSEWIEKSTVFVLPSFYREGVPRSIQEAMAIGRPIITTDVPGCRETVEDGVNGFLIPPCDVEALVKAMEKFILYPELVTSMGKKSREIAEERYNVHEVNKRIMKVLFPDGS